MKFFLLSFLIEVFILILYRSQFNSKLFYIIFAGSFDSNWNVCGVLEKRLQPLPFSFALSGRLNHTKNQFRLGCGLIIG